MAVETLPLLGLILFPETDNAIKSGSREHSEGWMGPSEAAHCAIVSVLGLVWPYLRLLLKAALVIGKLDCIAFAVGRGDDDHADIIARGKDSPEFVHLNIDLAKKSEFGEAPTV